MTTLLNNPYTYPSNIRTHPPTQTRTTQQPSPPKIPHSFIQKCSQLAHGRRRHHHPTTFLPSPLLPASPPRAPTIAHWTQTLAAPPAAYETYLDALLDDAVGSLVCGPHAAAEEVELLYNHAELAATAPGAPLRVYAKVRAPAGNGNRWIEASVTVVGWGGGGGDVATSRVLVYGKWLLRNTMEGRGYVGR